MGFDGDWDDIAANLAFVLTRCPNLRRVGYIRGFILSFHFEWKTVSTLASSCGHRLLDLQVALLGYGTIENSALLSKFTKLRALCLTSNMSFSSDCTELPGTAFCDLESLDCTIHNDTFLRLMASLEWVHCFTASGGLLTHPTFSLPQIRSVSFPRLQQCPGASFFLQKHGPKLQFLQTILPLSINVFETCPNLKIFGIPDDCRNVDALKVNLFSLSVSFPTAYHHPYSLSLPLPFPALGSTPWKKFNWTLLPQTSMPKRPFIFLVIWIYRPSHIFGVSKYLTAPGRPQSECLSHSSRPKLSKNP